MKITEYDIERFTMGDCAILARAIHKLTGWPLMGFAQEQSYLPERNGEPITHAFVLAPKRFYLDIRGLQTEKEIRDNFNEPSSPIMPYTLEDFTQHWYMRKPGRRGWKPGYHGSTERARRLAPYIVTLAKAELVG